jgi:hypothetical protein
LQQWPPQQESAERGVFASTELSNVVAARIAKRYFISSPVEFRFVPRSRGASLAAKRTVNAAAEQAVDRSGQHCEQMLLLKARLPTAEKEKVSSHSGTEISRPRRPNSIVDPGSISACDDCNRFDRRPFACAHNTPPSAKSRPEFAPA